LDLSPLAEFYAPCLILWLGEYKYDEKCTAASAPLYLVRSQHNKAKPPFPFPFPFLSPFFRSYFLFPALETRQNEMADSEPGQGQAGSGSGSGSGSAPIDETYYHCSGPASTFESEFDPHVCSYEDLFNQFSSTIEQANSTGGDSDQALEMVGNGPIWTMFGGHPGGLI
jgi:hypothetical protein